MGIDDPPRDVEAETGPGHRPGAAAHELVEDALELVRVDPGAVVLDDEAGHVVGLLQGDLDGDLRRCVLAGVVEEVREDLLDAVGIAVHHDRGVRHPQHHVVGGPLLNASTAVRTSSARSIGCRT